MNMAEFSHSILKGLPISINPDRPPENFRDAISRVDKRKWATSYDKESQGCFERKEFNVIQLKPGIKIHDTNTRKTTALF